MMQTLSEILSLSTDFLKKKGVSNSRRQAEELLCDALNMTRLQIYLEFDRPLNSQELEICRSYLHRRSRKEPLAYIKGEIEFYHCQFTVNPSVLIPRQETEILVDKISNHLKTQSLEGKVLWDICTGSGCIGISLKKRFPDLHVVLSDISKEALLVAKQNAERNKVDVHVVEGHLLEPFKGQKADFFVCNPPYISTTEYLELDLEVRQHEPRLALESGITGLEFYQALSQQLPNYLKAGAHAWFEIGYQQGEVIKTLFQDTRWKRVDVENDWAGHNRFFFLENE